MVTGVQLINTYETDKVLNKHFAKMFQAVDAVSEWGVGGCRC